MRELPMRSVAADERPYVQEARRSERVTYGLSNQSPATLGWE